MDDYLIYYGNWFRDTDEYYRVQSLGLANGRLSRVRSYPKGVAVLELGCGPGLTLNALRDLGFQNLRGIDIGEAQCLIAQRRGLPVLHVLDTPAWLESCNEDYGIILAFDVLEHMDRDTLRATLHKLSLSLTVDGVFVGTVPNANHCFAGRVRYGDYTHRVAFTEHSLKYVLKTCGFDVQLICEEDRVSEGRSWAFSLRRMVRACFRSVRRLEAIAEFGLREGMAIPLSRNLYFEAKLIV